MAQQLGLPQVSFDTARWGHYKAIGYDPDFAAEVRKHGGFLALSLYWNLFDAYAVEQTLLANPLAVFDFGAGVYESHESLSRVQAALANWPNIVLLLPTPDLSRSLHILRQRDSRFPADLEFDLNAHFLKHPSYSKLAKWTVYTEGKSPQETCLEIRERAGL